MCTDAFNEYMFPILDSQTYQSPVMVLFSNFRNYAYILTSEPDTWDEFAPIAPPHGPLPEGFGFLGLWGWGETGRYRPRPFSEFINGNYSEPVKAAVRYLNVCLNGKDKSH